MTGADALLIGWLTALIWAWTRILAAEWRK